MVRFLLFFLCLSFESHLNLLSGDEYACTWCTRAHIQILSCWKAF